MAVIDGAGSELAYYQKSQWGKSIVFYASRICININRVFSQRNLWNCVGSDTQSTFGESRSPSRAFDL